MGNRVWCGLVCLLMVTFVLTLGGCSLLTGEGKIVTDKVTVRRVEEAVAKEIVAEFEGVKEISFSQIRKRDSLIGGYSVRVNLNGHETVTVSIKDLTGSADSVRYGTRYNLEKLNKYGIGSRETRINTEDIDLTDVKIQYSVDKEIKK